jgi:hypothetical protein
MGDRVSRFLKVAIPLVVVSMAHSEVTREPLRTNVIFDAGQIIHSKYAEVHDGEMLQSTSLTLTQTVDLNERLDVSVGLGGLFFYTIPNVNGLSYQRGIKYGTTVSQALLDVKLGAVADPLGHFLFGIIPYKYNPDANNLGEFLLRDEAYPTVMVSGGLSTINSAGMQVEGAQLQLLTGPLNHDLLLYTERGTEPTGDLSAAYIFSYKPHPVFELGGGVAFAHLISFKPSSTTPTGPLLSPVKPSATGDVAEQPMNRYKDDTVVTNINTVGYSNYTFKATKVMARISLNPQAILKSDLLGEDDLKLYSEAAILGTKNYPYFYNDIMARTPIMAGFNFPTFRLLDKLSIEMEYLKPAFPNSNYWSYATDAVPVPGIIPAGDQTFHDVLYGGVSANDGSIIKPYDRKSLSHRAFKWSVYLERKLVPGLTLYAQAASDYMRGYNANVGPGALVPLYEPIIKTPSDWYYLVRLSLGI